ncbi:YwdI family protein [Priestia flexa]|uniref:YwdI family protein n=1 Tax=Priestia flexa TaxID=86664 RepID=UPI003D2F2C4A
MEIKLEQLLDKMSAELAKAKQEAHHSARLRDQLIAIKTLCELALADGNSSSSVKSTAPSSVVMPSQIQAQPSMQQQIIQSSRQNFEGEKLASDDANGDSLFDF